MTTAAELAELDLDLHPGAPATAIDRDRKCVRVASGQEHRYDRLVLATGSRARRLPDLPVAREGVVTLRNRDDAHAAMALVTAGSRVLIVVGGLLGLELAAALAGQVAAITVLQNRSLLLGRQLDATGSEVLRAALIERGVRLMFNDRVASYSGTPRISGVRTEGGLILDCDLLLVAVGTVPNRELGTATGLHTRRALVVNSHLQTSDPEIYALGEIAEHNGRLYGTTEHAQEQARVAARHATGDEWAAYADAPPYNVLKIPGTSVSTVGLTAPGDGDDDLRAAVAAGSATLAELCAATRAGTGCGTCRPEVAAVLAESAGTPRAPVEPSAGAGAAAPEPSEPMASDVTSTAARPVLTAPPGSAGAAAPERCEPMASDVTSTAALPALAGPPGSADAAAPESDDSSCTAPAATAEAVSTLEEQPCGEFAERPEAALV